MMKVHVVTVNTAEAGQCVDRVYARRRDALARARQLRQGKWFVLAGHPMLYGDVQVTSRSVWRRKLVWPVNA